MINFLKTILSANFIWGVIVGGVGVYIFRPLIDSGLKKLFKKNT